jgi:hypothetical protein
VTRRCEVRLDSVSAELPKGEAAEMRQDGEQIHHSLRLFDDERCFSTEEAGEGERQPGLSLCESMDGYGGPM